MIVNPLSANRVWDRLEEPDWWGRAQPMPKDISDLQLIEAEVVSGRDMQLHALRLRIHAHFASEGRVILPPEDRTHPEGIRLIKAYRTDKEPKKNPTRYKSLAATILNAA